MYKHISLVFLTLFLTSCNDNATADEGKGNITQEPTGKNTEITNNTKPFDLGDIAGKYASDEGDLEIAMTEGMVLFKLLVVSATGKTGDMEGEMTLEKNTGIYKNKLQDCKLQFKFTNKQVEVTQKGTCEMGVGVTASGTYKSMTEANASSVIGKASDSLGSLFYTENEATYKKYCKAGMKEESGNIICRAKQKSGEMSDHIIHIFSGEYSGPDGELPPLKEAKAFKLSLTR